MEQSFLCPITSQIMRDPMIGSDGHTYERTAILTWLAKEPISPITREPMYISDLMPNRAIKGLIDEYLKTNPTNPESVNSTRVVSGDNLTTSLCVNRYQDKSIVSIETPNNMERLSADIVCVVDVSGSMGTSATMRSSDGSVQEHGLTILDVVKHAMKTVVNVLDEQDRLAIIAYDTTVETIQNLTAMTSLARSSTISQIDKLQPKCQTNLWGGISRAFEMAQSRQDSTRNLSIMLFTDGIPNISPPRGEVSMMQKYREEHKLLATLHTFGFGYNLEEYLLPNLAKCGNGMYSFIPDSSFVGTIFVNAISAILATMASNAIFVHVEDKTGPTVIPVGPIQFGNCRHIVLNTSETMKCTLTYEVGFKTISKQYLRL